MGPELKKTPLHAWHRDHAGQMVEFAGWEMPISYKPGIIEKQSFKDRSIRGSLGHGIEDRLYGRASL